MKKSPENKNSPPVFGYVFQNKSDPTGRLGRTFHNVTDLLVIEMKGISRLIHCNPHCVLLLLFLLNDSRKRKRRILGSPGHAVCLSYCFRCLFVVYDLTKVSLQGSASYQTAVNVGLCKQFRCISSVHRSAVLDTDGFCSSLIINFRDALTNALAHFLCLSVVAVLPVPIAQIGS